MESPHNSNSRPKYGVLSDKSSAGPHGLGDPDDKTIRTAEEHLVSKMMREESKKRCFTEDTLLAECLSEGGFIFRCRQASIAVKRCQLKWFDNEEFNKEMLDKYLDIRTEYRRTGVSDDDRTRQKKTEEEYQVWIKHKEEKFEASPTG